MAWQAKEIAPIIVSTVVIAGFIVVCSLLFTKIIPAESKDIAQIMFGGLVAMATTVVNYWMGSSSGSAKKDDTIAEMRSNHSERERLGEELYRANEAKKLQDSGKIIVTDTTMSNTVTSNTTTSTVDKNDLLGGR